jgi:hypothetical protein
MGYSYREAPPEPILPIPAGSWEPIKMIANQDQYFVLFKRDPREVLVNSIMES